MDFLLFLREINKTPILHDVHIASIYKESIEHSSIFLNQLSYYLKTSLSSNLIFLNINEQSLPDLRTKLDVSFLGNRLIYCIKNFYLLETNEKKIWQTYFQAYQGPHCIIYFDNQLPVYTQSDNKIIINLPDHILQETYLTLYQVFFNSPCDSVFVKKLFKQQSKVSLDQLITIMRYQVGLGRKFDDFFLTWFNKIVIPEKSFFNLSTALFAQDKKLFFEYWGQYKLAYAEEFWITYWSEQLWQAINFISKINSSISDAKKSVNRLPFSFINKDWKRYNLKFLISAHNDLYQIDYNLKNGLDGQFGLEYWYHRFLLHKF